MNFINPTKGKMSIQEMVQDIVAFMEEEPSTSYKLIIGTDSQSREESCFVTAVIIHRVGKGARYYYYKKYMSHVKNLRHKIFTETSMSLDAVTQLKEEMAKTRYKNMDVEIHVDIGQNGDTKELIREVVGWVMGSGFKVKIKPDACGATKVADKYTK
ncbi:ribonuclease H-like YkuK family protein [Tepidanaerobacter acetatoxydans]|uniref:ribonuclease H-like YkuK family protein n=1 Tax=Tepidanaerobacter acetatoxydans TaxID=499229 RepID=UPI001BD41121|nr:ribonuclease H-like YkuK family protein [Tepidanaerobacter acetatoxydans]